MEVSQKSEAAQMGVEASFEPKKIYNNNNLSHAHTEFLKIYFLVKNTSSCNNDLCDLMFFMTSGHS